MKTCILCDVKIPRYYILCRKHYSEYHEYIHEPWFIELAKQQNIQDTIDMIEFIGYPELKDVGRPNSTWIIANVILKRYDDSLREVEIGLRKRPMTLRELASSVNGVISYTTVRNLLRKYGRSINLS